MKKCYKSFSKPHAKVLQNLTFRMRRCCYLQERRSFPLELEPMTKEALQVHIAQTHFRCPICSDLTLYDDERYMNHMHQRHYKCHLCAMAGRPGSWHRDWHHLNSHFR